MILRPGTPKDARALAAILGDWVRETAWMPVLHSRDDDLTFVTRLIADAQVTVADSGTRPLGFLARERAEVTALYVAADARGRGVGRRLIAAAQATQSKLTLWTFAANAGARRFYARQGFVEIGATDGDNEEGLPDIRLGWSSTSEEVPT